MNRLKDLRREMGLSQQALADKLNVSQQTICKYENNTCLLYTSPSQRD